MCLRLNQSTKSASDPKSIDVIEPAAQREESGFTMQRGAGRAAG